MWVPAQGEFEALEPYVTSTALYSSDQPDGLLGYREGTRDHILTEIDAWAQDLNSPSILCITGPIGSGKTVMLKKAAYPVRQRAHLAGDFFFWDDDAVLSGLKTFPATIAHRIGFILPSAAIVIRQTLESNLAILEASLEEQWTALVIRPLETLAGNPISFRPLFIIDGVDQCSLREDQLWVIRKMVELCIRFPVGLILSARSEHHLQLEVKEYQDLNPSLFRPVIELADDDDARQQLRSLIYPLYRMANLQEVDPSWNPSLSVDETFESLVSDASGQFMVVPCIADYFGEVTTEQGPVQLKRLHSDGLIQAKVFVLLDRRYDSLMNSAERYLTSEQKILRDKIFYYLLHIQLDSIHSISLFWDTSPADIRGVLEQYLPVIRIPKSNNHSLHFDTFTFEGFLSSEHRGGKNAKHYISKSRFSVEAFERSLYLASHPGLHKTVTAPAHLFSLWLKLYPHINASSEESTQKTKHRIVSAVKGFNFPRWLSEWYLVHGNDDLDEEYAAFRDWFKEFSKAVHKKFSEDALSKSREQAAKPPNFRVRLFRMLQPKWMSGVLGRKK